MPTPAVKSMANKAGVSLGDAEAAWSKAKAAAAKQGMGEDYGLVMTIFKRILGVDERQAAALAVDALLETTISAVVPVSPAPFGMVEPVATSNRMQVVQGLKSIFPSTDPSALEKLVFGNNLQPVLG